MAKRSFEPFFWMLFSAGGVLAGLLLPILVLLLGVAIPLGFFAPSYEHLLVVLHHPLTRLVLFFLCFLSLFHGFHRLCFTLYDGLQIKHLSKPISMCCYGGAL